MNWTPEEQLLIDWFYEMEKNNALPNPPFQLSPGITVIGPKFYNRIKEEINAGPICPRARTGALQYDLFCLKKVIEQDSYSK